MKINFYNIKTSEAKFDILLMKLTQVFIDESIVNYDCDWSKLTRADRCMKKVITFKSEQCSQCFRREKCNDKIAIYSKECKELRK